MMKSPSFTVRAVAVSTLAARHDDHERWSGAATIGFNRIAPVAAARITAHRYQTVANADRLYQCSACQKTFRLPNALNHHISTRHAGQAKVIVCSADGTPLPDESAPAAASSRPAAANTPPRPSATSTPVGTVSAAPSPSAPTGNAATAQAAPAPNMSGPSEPAAAGAMDPALQFVCTVCGKGFRLEAALQHHYQAKHNMDMPTPTAASQAASAGATAPSAAPTPQAPPLPADAASGTVNPDAAARQAAPASPLPPTPSFPGATAAAAPRYVPATETITPQPPLYQLDAYPNAPDECDVAAHPRCVNSGTFVGTVTDVQRGYLFEDPVVQFVVVTEFEGAPQGDPDKDFHTVRVFGSDSYLNAVAAQLRDGARVLVSGRVRMVPQYEPTMSKYYHFAVVHVHEGGGAVQDL